MSQIFKKGKVFTIPNILSIFRILLIPVIVWLYFGVKNYYAALGVIALSALTDILDGKIARKFNMVSDFGKIIDPIADKMTLGILIICLISKYKLMIPLIIVFIVKELFMMIAGYMILKKKDSVNSARWYGKLATAVMYGVIMTLVLFPDIPECAANILICLCGGTIILSLVLYANFYYGILKKNKN